MDHKETPLDTMITIQGATLGENKTSYYEVLVNTMGP